MTLWTPEVYFFFFLHTLMEMHIDRCAPWHLALLVTRILNMHDIWEQMLSVFSTKYDLLVISTHIQKSPQKVQNG